MDCSPPGSSVHGILQARILERVVMPSSRDLPYQGSNLSLLLVFCVWQAGSLPRAVCLRVFAKSSEPQEAAGRHSRSIHSFISALHFIWKRVIGESLLSLRWEAAVLSITFRRVCSVARLWLTLWDITEGSPPGSSVHGISQARILKWIAISSSGGSSWPRDWTRFSCVSCIGR